ncbi:Rpn family recombination-promoting nuclease/putative transposase [Chromatocurvus halotolerans]|uniref:Putative transposase/invertase (TIGR01784 family) n=1 Tax=Chromatocurvus halotolerans TaxID=1132028 RepID=A0A4R2KK92_9GAMM|nr:Rpn family recombination-promoting nuclease/putative transposase [Chromatocurvus halotolerans]TCO73744.1 putative transposase/invertase (TIGR01784 family) [Chromatocurvus halotolerans]
MASQHHDTGYKELFSHPEFVQQLVEEFAPPRIAALMDFTTLQIHSGNYITPLFEEKFEDVVWSVAIHSQGMETRVYLYMLLEFQSSLDRRMPLRLLHYVACFYDNLLKSGATTAGKGLPPVLPIVLYNGSRRWTAHQDIYNMIRPEPPEFLRVYQPHLRYYLIDEGSYTGEELRARHSPLSGVFGIENASQDLDSLQQAVDRVIAIIRADPNKERTDAIITRWLKRHLQRLGVSVDLDQLNSVVEQKDMLAKKWGYLGEKERREGRLEGERRVLQRQLARRFGELPDWAAKRLETASAEQLEAWADEILVTASVEELLGNAK